MSVRTKARTGGGKALNTPGAATVRAWISFQHEVYETLDAIAKEKRVSLAWVVRDAAEKYIGDSWPIIAKRNGG